MEHVELRAIALHIDGMDINFPLVRTLAEQLATEVLDGPMLIAWYDGRRGEEHPTVPECQHKPGWLAYAEGHGGCLRIDVNNQQYSLIFAESGIETQQG